MISVDDILAASILIVGDQDANVPLERMLREAGHRCVASTADPHAVCALHRDNRYDLILLDPQMPGMDGFEVIEGLKKIETVGAVPLLVVAAQPGHRLQALASGAKDFIGKPFDLAEVRTRIHNVLEVRLLYRQLDDYSRALESMVLHDALTGLPNRRLLSDRLSLAIAHAHRSKSTMAVMHLDLDGFTQINDTLGRDAGDALLRMVADRLVAAVRQEDTVARLGGDEFVIGMRELGHADVVAKPVSRVIQAVSQPYKLQGRDVCLTVSVGVGMYPIHGETVVTLMQSADLALYEAKHAGKNDFRIARARLASH